MVQQFSQQIKIRTGLYIFLKGANAPVVLYCENPQAVYEEIKQVMKSPAATLVEKDGTGPIKRLCVLSTQIQGVAMQDEQYS